MDEGSPRVGYASSLMSNAKYDKRAQKAGSLVCVGLDSDIEKLPERFKKLKHPQFEFNKWIIEETHEFAAAYKPNVAFYEARGTQGIEELKATMDYLGERHPDIFTICDAKRADIGNTNRGYVSFLFDWMGFDAVTVHPYLGREALEPFLSRADKASIVLCRTSNPGAGELQDLLVDPIGNSPSSNGASGKPLWWVVADKVAREWNKNGNCMLVVGATYPEEMKEIRNVVGDMTFLVPGVGAQGGEVKATVEAGRNSVGRGMIISASRAVIFSNEPKKAAKELRDEINSRIVAGRSRRRTQ